MTGKKNTFFKGALGPFFFKKHDEHVNGKKTPRPEKKAKPLLPPESKNEKTK
jgi:hypothetical protein